MCPVPSFIWLWWGILLTGHITCYDSIKPNNVRAAHSLMEWSLWVSWCEGLFSRAFLNADTQYSNRKRRVSKLGMFFLVMMRSQYDYLICSKREQSLWVALAPLTFQRVGGPAHFWLIIGFSIKICFWAFLQKQRLNFDFCKTSKCLILRPSLFSIVFMVFLQLIKYLGHFVGILWIFIIGKLYVYCISPICLNARIRAVVKSFVSLCNRSSNIDWTIKF